MRPMKIALNAHLLSARAGYRSAGIHSAIHHLLLHLPAALPPDWDLNVLVGGANRAQYPGLNMRRARFDTEAPLRRILWEQVAQPAALCGHDLYHAMAFVGPLLPTPPMVVTVYDLSFLHYPERLPPARRLYLRLLTGLSCRRARRVLVISHSTGQDVARLLGVPPERIDVTPLAHDAARCRPLPADEVQAFRRDRGLPPRFWLFVGTLEPRKNLVTLLEAYAALPRSERAPLVLAGGKGWLYNDIFAAIERHALQDEVHLPGFLPTDEMPLWYNSAEIFVYPSVYEGFGLPVLEAMACGTPVLTSDLSSLPEVAGQAAICVPPHDVQAWTQALRRAGGDPQWRAAAREQGLQQAARFSWDRTAALTAASYRRALNL